MGKTETETINPRRDKTSNAQHSRRKTMFRKITLALVAAASLSAMALAPTAASAGGFIWPTYHPPHHWGHGLWPGLRFLRWGLPSASSLGPWLWPWHRLVRWRLQRLLSDPDGADAVRLPPAHHQRLRFLIEPFCWFKKAPAA